MKSTSASLCIVFATVMIWGVARGSAKAAGEFGHLLREYPQGSIWWAEGTYKVFRETGVPEEKSEAIKISAAGNEYEPFQLVLRPKVEVPEVNFVEVSDFRNGSGDTISQENVEVNTVEYVKVEKPTDGLGHVGLYPDPLPAFKPNLVLRTGENQPIWFTVYVPSETPAGLYRGGIVLTVGGWRLEEIPVSLEVYDFTLPKETHTETAYGVSLNANYHGLESQEDKEKTYDLYMQNCAKHRISPYAPMRFHRIRCRVEPASGDGDARIELDFSDFDEAARKYLDEYGFTAFNFASIVSGFDVSPRWNNEDEKRLKAQVIKKVCDHLAEKGWLKKAYDYWIDEPPRDKYEEVMESMLFLKETEPRLRRLLTFCHDKSPLPFFYGGVNLWVPVLSLFHPERANERQALEESVWWYVCCGPHHPYPNNFIDHPAINHRIRFWMIQKYGTDGSLYWSVTYWRQNPWKTAMSYSPQGGTWGNGDGRLLYPPTKEPPEKPMVCGPINSIRFEMLREGLEDREYLWVLSQRLKELKKRSGAPSTEAVENGEKAMGTVDRMVRRLIEYETDPKRLYGARDEVARAIVSLQEGR